MTTSIPDNARRAYYARGEFLLALRTNRSITTGEIAHQLREVGKRELTVNIDMLKRNLATDNTTDDIRDDLFKLLDQRADVVTKVTANLSKQLTQISTENVWRFPFTRTRQPIDTFVSLRLDDPSEEEDEADEALAIIAVALNLQGPRDLHGIQIVHFTPNWLFSAAQGNLISGGPGGIAVAPASNCATKFHVPAQIDMEGRQPTEESSDKQGKLRDILAGSANQMQEAANVDVFILDTIPACDVLQDAACAYSNNPRIQRMLSTIDQADCASPEIACSQNLTLHYNNSNIFDPAFSSGLRDYNHDLATGIIQHDYEMADHGLFVADLIDNIAPGANIHLLEVLNHHGVGTLLSLTWGLQQILLHQQNACYINCSLTLSIESNICRDNPRGIQALFCVIERLGWDIMLWPLRELFELFAGRDCMTLAAAGNDGVAAKNAKSARYPAMFNNVLGVAAMTSDFQDASYSNIADDPPFLGFRVFGGDVDHQNPPEASDTHGVLGCYTAPTYQNGARNESGFARWAGTSFATAILTGVFARLSLAGMNLTDAYRFLHDTVEEVDPQASQRLPIMQG